MAETVFEHLDGNKTFTVSTDERTWKNRLVKLAEQHPDDVECVAVNRDGSMMFHVPESWIKIRPPRKVNMSDERKAKLAERMRNIRNTA
jgi:hypothetical protein